MARIKAGNNFGDLILLSLLALAAFFAVLSGSRDFLIAPLTEYIPVSQTINIYADPTRQDDTTAMLRLTVQNGTVTDFKPSFPLSVGTCENGRSFSGDEVCIDMSKGSPILENELLGELSVLPDGEAGISIEYGKDNGYYNGLAISDVSGSLINYQTGQVAGESTNQNMLVYSIVLITVGAVFITIFVVFYLQRNKLSGSSVTTVFSVFVIIALGGLLIYFNDLLQDSSLAPTDTKAAVIDKNVLVLIYNPDDPADPETSFVEYVTKSPDDGGLGWNDPLGLTSFLSSAWFNSYYSDQVNVSYTIEEIKSFPKFKTGFTQTWGNYFNFCMRYGCENYELDYRYLIGTQTGANLCDRFNASEFDEIWLMGGDQFGLAGSILIGEGAFGLEREGVQPLNPGDPEEPITCSDLLPVMGFSMKESENDMVRFFGRRSEFTMDQVYGKYSMSELRNNWDKFKLIDGMSDTFSFSGCGGIDYAPNVIDSSEREVFDSGNITSSFCNSFLLYPEVNIENREDVNCDTWQCSRLGYYRWWFDHIPAAEGVNPDDGFYNNWWLYIFNPTLVRDGLIPTATAVPSNTPEPTGTLAPTVTSGPTVTPGPSFTPAHTGTPIPTSSPQPTSTPAATPTIMNTATPLPTPTISPTVNPVAVTCGNSDIDANSVFNYVDFDSFAKVYNRYCDDTPAASACGPKDINGDGFVNYVDFDSFAKRYYPFKATCVL